MVTVQDILTSIHSWAPTQTAQSYDNVGLQVGRTKSEVHKGLIALDLTPDIVNEAIQSGIDLVVTHHPLLFKPLSKLTDESLVSGMALALAENGIALVAAHTNLDAARDGVSFHLAEQLGLERIGFISGLDGMVQKLIVFVPPDHAEAVRMAAHEAGGGQIGLYSHCSFSVGGTGQFKPGNATHPFLGEPDGPTETVHEVRIEMEVTTWNAQAVLSAINRVHPYEEVAYDLIPVLQPYRNAGIGAIGVLPKPVSLENFLSVVSASLSTESVRYAGNLDSFVSKIAVCGGSGSDFIRAAAKAGADAFVTGDLTYHRYFDVLDQAGAVSMALIDAGHYETEQGCEDLLLQYLNEKFDAVVWRKTAFRSSPSQIWVNKSVKPPN